jgi:hypothetical protein
MRRVQGEKIYGPRHVKIVPEIAHAVLQPDGIAASRSRFDFLGATLLSSRKYDICPHHFARFRWLVQCRPKTQFARMARSSNEVST